MSEVANLPPVPDWLKNPANVELFSYQRDLIKGIDLASGPDKTAIVFASRNMGKTNALDEMNKYMNTPSQFQREYLNTPSNMYRSYEINTKELRGQLANVIDEMESEQRRQLKRVTLERAQLRAQEDMMIEIDREILDGLSSAISYGKTEEVWNGEDVEITQRTMSMLMLLGRRRLELEEIEQTVEQEIEQIVFDYAPIMTSGVRALEV